MITVFLRFLKHFLFICRILVQHGERLPICYFLAGPSSSPYSCACCSWFKKKNLQVSLCKLKSQDGFLILSSGAGFLKLGHGALHFNQCWTFLCATNVRFLQAFFIFRLLRHVFVILACTRWFGRLFLLSPPLTSPFLLFPFLRRCFPFLRLLLPFCLYSSGAPLHSSSAGWCAPSALLTCSCFIILPSLLSYLPYSPWSLLLCQPIWLASFSSVLMP